MSAMVSSIVDSYYDYKVRKVEIEAGMESEEE